MVYYRCAYCSRGVEHAVTHVQAVRRATGGWAGGSAAAAAGGHNTFRCGRPRPNHDERRDVLL